jgi:2-polyprenyl-3-methyl-5-hydroxy-6-metoxy-1,4-benzoquinol methylase
MRYYAGPKISYGCCDVERGGWEGGLGLFDGIVAFEILEHLQSDQSFWRGIALAMAPGGVLWLSTPLGRGRGLATSDPHHVHQLRRSEVARLFASRWNPLFYGQSGAWIEPWTAGRRYYTILVRATLNR